ncbi:MAG: hypothetical protein ABIF01_02105 [Candidatus Micrarchaeota archaeon]
MASAQLEKRILTLAKDKPPSQSRATLLSNGMLVERGPIMRELGSRYLGIDDIKVWGNKKEGHGRMNDSTALVVRKEPTIAELSDSDIKEGGNLGLVVVGFGNAFNNGWYGAGPTRDLRRATLASRIIAITSNITLVNTNLIGHKSSEFLRAVSTNLNGNFQVSDSSGPSWSSRKSLIQLNTYALQRGDETSFATFWLTTLSKEKAGVMASSVNGDLVITLTFGPVSGHRFLPREVRQTSPLHGSLDSFLNTDGVYADAKKWIDGQIGRLREIVDKLLPQGQKADVIEAVTVYNT